MSVTPPNSRSGSPGRGVSDLSGNRPRKFLNGWTKEQEDLMAEWSDKAGCYRWLHDKCEKKYAASNMAITIPVIILSTLTGTANFALGSFIPPDNNQLKNYVQAGIGAVSIFAGILTTLGNFLRYAQGSEANRVAGIAWGKFQRQIAVELAIHPNERIDSMDFLKICRAELDRLIEQSPAVPDDVIEEFEKEFKDMPDIKKPEICHGLEHTKVFRDNKSRLLMMTSEASLMLKHKKRVLREELLPEMNSLVEKKVKEHINDISGVVIDMNSRKNTNAASSTGSPTIQSKAAGKYAHYNDDYRMRPSTNNRSITSRRQSRASTVGETTAPVERGRTRERENVNQSSDIHIDIVGSARADHLNTKTDTKTDTGAGTGAVAEIVPDDNNEKNETPPFSL